MHLFYFILFYFILFCFFILFYFIILTRRAPIVFTELKHLLIAMTA